VAAGEVEDRGVLDLGPATVLVASMGALSASWIDLHAERFGGPRNVCAVRFQTEGSRALAAGDLRLAAKRFTRALALAASGAHPSGGTVVAPGSPPPAGPIYPVVFVDSPRNATPPAVPSGYSLPQVDFPEIAGNAPGGALRSRESKLKMLHPDGTVETLFGAPKGCVLHPSVSFDGAKIYFAYNPDLTNDAKRFDILRMDWTLPGHPVTNLTASYVHRGIFDDAGLGPNGLTAAHFDLPQTVAAGNVRLPIKLQFWSPFEYLDPEGRIKVMAVSSWNAERLAKSTQNVGDLVVMDPDGSKLRTFLHVPGGTFFPFQSPTGEIYWGEINEHFSRRAHNNFSIMKCSQDGTNHQQFDRFHLGFFDIGAPIRNTLSFSVNGVDIVGGIYYGGNNAGWGALQAVPDDLPGPIDFSTNDDHGDAHLHAPIVRLERTFLTFGPQLSDPDGPNPMGKFRDPAPVQGEGMIVAYSPGPASFQLNGAPFIPVWQRWDAGIYYVPTGSKIPIGSPTSLVPLYQVPTSNSFMPKQAAPYTALYGMPLPVLQPNPNRNDGASGVLLPGSPYAIARGAALHVGEFATAPNPWTLHWHFLPNGVPTPGVWNPGWSFSGGGWPLPKTFQGYKNGDFFASDVKFVRVLARKRILGTVPFVDTGMDGPDDENTWFGAIWTILGEFDVRAFKSSPNDTSFKIKFPADTPVMFQALDRYGMAVASETFLREHKPGSVTTCKGCHVRGISGVEFASTEAANPAFPTHDAVVNHRIVVPNFQAGSSAWTPLVSGTPQVWTFEDVKPIFATCLPCHAETSPGGAAAGLNLEDREVNGKSLYRRIAQDYEVANPEGYDPVYQAGKWHPPNLSRFVKAGSARESLLLWKLVGPLVGNPSHRLDGRLNSTFPTEFPPGTYSFGMPANGLNFLVDVDNLNGGCLAHLAVQSGLVSNQAVARLIRWIDVGCPSTNIDGLPAHKALDLDYEPPSAGIWVDMTTTPLPTVWLGAWDEGALDLTTGKLQCADSGLEVPLLALAETLTEPMLNLGIALGVPVTSGETVVFSIEDAAGNIRRVYFETD
jgi:hypothetical protein